MSMKDLLLYEKDKSGKETLAVITAHHSDGGISQKEVKGDMVSRKFILATMRAYAMNDYIKGKAQKEVVKDMKDSDVDELGGFLESINISDDKENKRVHIDPDQIVVGPKFLSMVANLLEQYVPKEHHDVMEKAMYSIVDQTADACANGFSQLQGHAVEKIAAAAQEAQKRVMDKKGA